MTTALTKPEAGSLAALDADTMNSLMAGGDCSRLTPAQKTAYYLARCEAAGLDARAQPFAFMRLNGKEVLYAQKSATDQLAAKHGLKTSIVSQTTDDGIRVVTVHVEAKDGRVTEEIGALPVGGLKGEALSNAMMKCVTKAKRRAVLSICGLGMLDETEVDSIPGAAPALRVVEPPPPEVPAHAPEIPAGDPPPFEPLKAASVLWTKLVAECNGDKADAKTKWEAAVTEHFGVDAPPGNTWHPDDFKKIDKILFDIRF